MACKHEWPTVVQETPARCMRCGISLTGWQRTEIENLRFELSASQERERAVREALEGLARDGAYGLAEAGCIWCLTQGECYSSRMMVDGQHTLGCPISAALRASADAPAAPPDHELTCEGCAQLREALRDCNGWYDEKCGCAACRAVRQLLASPEPPPEPAGEK